MACKDVSLESGAVQVELFDCDTNELIDTITQDDQLEDATIGITQQYLELRNQSSSAPVRHNRTGLEAILALSIATYTLEKLATVFGTDIVVDATDNTKRKIVLGDRAGEKPKAFKVVIKPYAGNAPTTDVEQWVTMPCAQAVNPNEVSIAYGINTQRSTNFALYAQSDPEGAKIILGDETAVAA